MARKKFQAEFWRENFYLFNKVTKEHDEERYEDIAKLKKRANTKNRTDLKDSKFEKEMNELASSINDESWNRFLKRVRDIRYEETSQRKRLTISEKSYDIIQNQVKKLGCKNPDQLLELLISTLTTEQRKKIMAKAKKINEK